MSEAFLRTLQSSTTALRDRLPGAPEVVVILGSGMGSAVPPMKEAVEIPYVDVPGFPRPTVEGHSGRLIFGRLASGAGAAVLQGRFHYYEGHAMAEAALPVRALAALGAKTLVATAAVGSMTPALKPGHLCVVRDHINFMGTNPLRGLHTPEFGAMFPDMGDAYDPALRRLALARCRRLRIPAREGVYAAAPGPSYETAAEIRALRRLGGDVVGMSVVPEAVTARQLGLRVLAFGWISNMAAGMSRGRLDHADVLALGERVAGRMRDLLASLLPEL